ncbi:MAG: hypothetical protein WAT66_04420 [Actinomycetota bacterium]
MGFPEGWTECLTRNQALKALGNAVVPQQALRAWNLLTAEMTVLPIGGMLEASGDAR